MGEIKILVTSIPDGTSPLWLREALVGLTFVASKTLRGEYEVPISDLITAFEKKGEVAAETWLRAKCMIQDFVFIFLKESCKEIPPTT